MPRETTAHTASEPSAAMRRATELCHECARICSETISYCLGKGGDHVAPEHIKALLDCAQICVTSAGFMARQSPSHPQLCGVCADVCKRCEESCEQFGDDAQMKRCADICRKTAESCREMSRASGSH
jgi:hypothetical protein